jgi:hypothetical protein
MAANAAILKRAIANLKLFKEQLAGESASLEAFDPEINDQFTLMQHAEALNELRRNQQAKIVEVFENLPDERFSDWVAEDAAFKKVHATCMAQVNHLLARYPQPGFKEEKHSTGNSIKLPEIPLPTFNGNYHEWVTFKHKSAELRKLLDVVAKNLRVLKSLNLGLDGLSEQIITNLVASRLDAETRKAIESQTKAEVYRNGMRCLISFIADVTHWKLSETPANQRRKPNRR